MPPPPQSWGPPPAPVTPPRGRRRKPVLIGLGAAAVVAALVVAGVVALRDGSDAASVTASAAASPGDAVRAYLAALSRGDAAAVLALSSDVPADKTFLTDAILKRQAAQAPITNVQILDEDTDAKGGSVHVRADFAGKTFDQTITGLSKSAGGWKLPKGVNELNADISGAMNPRLRVKMTIFGKPLPDDGKAFVFPGPIDLGSSDPNIEFTQAQASQGAYISSPLDQIGLGTTNLMANLAVTKAGEQAVRDAVKALANSCVTTRQLAPPNCPNVADTAGFIDGTAQWTAPQDFAGLQVKYLSPDGTVGVTGPLNFGLTVQTNTGPQTTQNFAFIMGKADMTQDPPKIILGR